MKVIRRMMWLVIATVITIGLAPGRAAAQGTASQSVEAKLPPDVNPNSRSRMPRAKREDFTNPEDIKAFDNIMAREERFRRKTGALGGTLTRIQLPTIAVLYRDLLIELEKKSGMEEKFYELLVTAASRETNNGLEFIAHEKNVRTDYGPDMVEMIRLRKELKGIPEKEATIIQFCREEASDKKVSSKTFADMERFFGRQGTLAASLIVGYYKASEMLFRTYDQHLNSGVKNPF